MEYRNCGSLLHKSQVWNCTCWDGCWDGVTDLGFVVKRFFDNSDRRPTSFLSPKFYWAHSTLKRLLLSPTSVKGNTLGRKMGGGGYAVTIGRQPTCVKPGETKRVWMDEYGDMIIEIINQYLALLLFDRVHSFRPTPPPHSSEVVAISWKFSHRRASCCMTNNGMGKYTRRLIQCDSDIFDKRTFFLPCFDWVMKPRLCC